MVTYLGPNLLETFPPIDTLLAGSTLFAIMDGNGLVRNYLNGHRQPVRHDAGRVLA